jgi:hypothetical protein
VAQVQHVGRDAFLGEGGGRCMLFEHGDPTEKLDAME